MSPRSDHDDQIAASDPDGPEEFEGTLMDGLENEPPYPSAAQDREWVTQVAKRDLNNLHHALRLSAKYPGMSEDERIELVELADVCWYEHTRRCEASRV